MYQVRPSGRQTLGWEMGVEEIYWGVKSARDKKEINIKGSIRQRKSDTNLISKKKKKGGGGAKAKLVKESFRPTPWKVQSKTCPLEDPHRGQEWPRPGAPPLTGSVTAEGWQWSTNQSA